MASSSDPGSQRTAGGVHATPVEPFEQRAKLDSGHPHYAILDPGPAEAALFEALGHEAQTRTVLPRQLDPIGALGPEHVNDAGKRIRAELGLDQRGQ